MWAAPSRMDRHGESFGAAASSLPPGRGTLSLSMTNADSRWNAAMTTYAQPMSQRATRTPVARGATMPATPKAAKFTAVALSSLRRPTTSMFKASTEGMRIASASPVTRDAVRRCHSST